MANAQLSRTARVMYSVGQLISTTFYKDLSNVYLKDVTNQRFNQSDHDIRFWYHGMVTSSIECIQPPLLHSLNSFFVCARWETVCRLRQTCIELILPLLIIYNYVNFSFVCILKETL